MQKCKFSIDNQMEKDHGFSQEYCANIDSGNFTVAYKTNNNVALLSIFVEKSSENI